VAQAYVEGLLAFVQSGGHPSRVNSVASFFVNRIDTLVDALITTLLTTVVDVEARSSLTGLLGRVAIASAKLAYQRYLHLCHRPEWRRLAASGAHPQRLLWASTSTKNPGYRDVRYVEELIGRDTVNTMTPAALEAFRDHGHLRATLEEHISDARSVIEALGRTGISLGGITDRLFEDGVARFSEAFDTLLAAVETGRQGAPSPSHPPIDRPTLANARQRPNLDQFRGSRLDVES
jgi:transaldolase/glucose-6-phosphate isomerase